MSPGICILKMIPHRTPVQGSPDDRSLSDENLSAGLYDGTLPEKGVDNNNTSDWIPIVAGKHLTQLHIIMFS